MLQVSQRAHYGLRAMTELAKSYGQRPVSLAEIAGVKPSERIDGVVLRRALKAN